MAAAGASHSTSTKDAAFPYHRAPLRLYNSDPGKLDPLGLKQHEIPLVLDHNADSLTLDGAVKCIYGQLHPLDRMLDRFQSLEHLSIANIGVSSLEKFPRLRNLQRLILSDNWISGGLEFLVGAGLESLRDLDLSNNRIQTLEDLAPLARLRLVSLDLYECPVTRVADYRWIDEINAVGLKLSK